MGEVDDVGDEVGLFVRRVGEWFLCRLAVSSGLLLSWNLSLLCVSRTFVDSGPPAKLCRR